MFCMNTACGIRVCAPTWTTENTHDGRACAEETRRSGKHCMGAHPSGLECNLDPQQRERSPSRRRPCIQWMSLPTQYSMLKTLVCSPSELRSFKFADPI